ncbi:MAG TPA: PD-(D/E)XK nuclease family protein [Opitutaceae bacterium]|nr:PD-(D/E)XK nuclease family protein [Opitutaceae bacterium]
MPTANDLAADNAALNDLLVNCPDFERLESLLGGFNLFQVLKFEHGEIRHSNVLAWILDPAESHGLDSTFLKKWLMRVLHEAGELSGSAVSAVDVDGWNLVDCEVRREWKNIDVLVDLTLDGGEQWVICIENKINSAQHSDQLKRYRAAVEDAFPDAARRIFIFLTKHNERPEDVMYVSASYAQVHQALKECLRSRANAIGTEPKVLLENYLRLLEEKFMDESEIARTALRIYQQHRRALDVIFEHRPDNLRMASERIRQLLADNAEQLGILPESSTKHYLRFIPRGWDVPGNTHGNAWAGCKRTILFELNLTGKRPYLYIISGKAPDPWIEPIWLKAGAPPFNRPKRQVRTRVWCTLHICNRGAIPLDDQEIADSADLAQKIYDWTVKSYRDPQTQEVVYLLADELPRLDMMPERGAEGM